MNLEQNLYDTVREWQLKLGYQREEMRLYYPEESLLELLDGGQAGQHSGDAH